MQIVERPLVSPGHCAVTGKSEPGRYADTGVVLQCIDPKVYVSEAGLEQLVFVLGGYVPVEQHDAAVEALARVEAERDQAFKTVQDLLEFKKATELVLAGVSDGE